MACIVMVFAVMAYTVMAYIVMVFTDVAVQNGGVVALLRLLSIGSHLARAIACRTRLCRHARRHVLSHAGTYLARAHHVPHVCTNMRADMSVHIEMFIDIRTDMCVEMCIDRCTWTCARDMLVCTFSCMITCRLHMHVS